MNNLTQEVFIFKTNVKNKKLIKKLSPLLDRHLLITKWNLDLEDCDKILRVEASSEIAAEIISLLQNKGFECEELRYNL